MQENFGKESRDQSFLDTMQLASFLFVDVGFKLQTNVRSRYGVIDTSGAMMQILDDTEQYLISKELTLPPFLTGYVSFLRFYIKVKFDEFAPETFVFLSASNDAFEKVACDFHEELVKVLELARLWANCRESPKSPGACSEFANAIAVCVPPMLVTKLESVNDHICFLLQIFLVEVLNDLDPSLAPFVATSMLKRFEEEHNGIGDFWASIALRNVRKSPAFQTDSLAFGLDSEMMEQPLDEETNFTNSEALAWGDESRRRFAQEVVKGRSYMV